MLAITLESSAWGAEVMPTASLDAAFLASEALQATNKIASIQFPILSSGPAAPSQTSTGKALPGKVSSAAASAQSRRRDLQALQAIANDADIKLKIAAAWTASNPKGPDRAEHGFWICRDQDTGKLYTRPFEGTEGPRHMIPGAPSVDAIAFFHTHPFTGVAQGPSAEDEQFADLSNLPGIIRSRVGLHYFGPGPKPWQPR